MRETIEDTPTENQISEVTINVMESKPHGVAGENGIGVQNVLTTDRHTFN